MDAAVADAERGYRVLQARVDLLETHITEARRLAFAAGVFNERTPLPVPEPPSRRAYRLAGRTAFARAMLR